MRGNLKCLFDSESETCSIARQILLSQNVLFTVNVEIFDVFSDFLTHTKCLIGYIQL